MNRFCMYTNVAEILSFNRGNFHMTDFYINKVMREEVELFE